MDNKIREFTDLNAWKEGHKLVILLYRATKAFPREEIFALTSQMRRAVVSVTSNIAEGFGRQSYKEKLQFYYMSQGSLVELKNQIYIARDVSYLSEKDTKDLLNQIVCTHCLLQGLIKGTKQRYK